MPRLEMTVTWVLATPLNIAGAPGDNPLADIPLLRQYRTHSPDAEILLPASTIKGKLRSEAQRLALTLGIGGPLCQGRTPETMCPAFWWDKDVAPEEHICLICRLFGSPWQPAALSFSNVTPQRIQSDDTMVRPGVGLSRVRGTAQEDLLFFVETTPPLEDGITFANCRIEGNVPDERAVALLWAAVQHIPAFGSGRSRGRGWLKAREVTIRVDGETWDQARLEAVWRDWLKLAAEGGEHNE